MYCFSDYLKRGLRFTNNFIFPKKKRLSSLMFYGTTLCDSRCKHCMIWQKRPVVHMPKEIIFSVMQSDCVTKATRVGLEGGEFLLHPDSMEILKWFSDYHPNFDLLSNCLKPDLLISAVKSYPPRRLYISLDGDKNTYKNMRGCDGFDKVIEVIEKCRNIIPISIMFTITPYNDFSDMEFIVGLSKRYSLDIRIGIYNNIAFFETTDEAHHIENNHPSSSFRSMIPENVKQTIENYDFLFLYEEWLNRNLIIKCHSIYDSIVIHPNGDIPICQNLNRKIGNIYMENLDDLISSSKTQEAQKACSKNCNACWINYHRKYDIVLLRTLEQFFPKRIIEVFYGKYQWTMDKNITYKQLLRN